MIFYSTELKSDRNPQIFCSRAPVLYLIETVDEMGILVGPLQQGRAGPGEVSNGGGPVQAYGGLGLLQAVLRRGSPAQLSLFLIINLFDLIFSNLFGGSGREKGPFELSRCSSEIV